MKYKSFLFFILTTLLVVVHEGQSQSSFMEYVFKKEVNLAKSVSFVVNRNEDPDDISVQIIGELDNETRKDLCTQVSKRHSLFDAYSVVGAADSYEIEDLDGNITIVKALQCPTAKEAWIHMDKSTKELVVTFLVHVAEQYKFGFEYIKSIERKMHYPKPEPDDHWGREQLRNNYLRTLNIIDRMYFCYWAHERVNVYTLAQQDLNRRNMCSGEYAAIWEVEYENSVKKKVIAIECGFKPNMYLRLIDPDDKSNRLMAMFLENKVNPLSILPSTEEIE